jgi:hypothetical protein
MPHPTDHAIRSLRYVMGSFYRAAHEKPATEVAWGGTDFRPFKPCHRENLSPAECRCGEAVRGDPLFKVISN